ncbi:MAG TPA: MFS transporter [Planctomycetota bacterium]|nr:MFS transporter [Planctomycetota bacterium]
MEKSTVEYSLDASIKDGASYNVMVGLGELYVGACAISLGASDTLVALLTTIPLFLGSCAQTVTPQLIDRTGRRRRWYMIGSILQAFTWIPMICAVFVEKALGFWLLLGGFMLYFMALQFTIPAWLSVMGDLVAPETRGRYFGRRTALGILLQFISGVTAGLGLWIFQQHGLEKWGFATTFGAAFLARWTSVCFLSRMVEPPYTPREKESFTLWMFLRRLPQSNFAKFVVFVGCLTASAQVVGCLFPLYWLKTLHYPYWWQYAACVNALVVVQIPALLFWGKMADRYGNKRVLTVTSIAVAVLPALWLLSTHVLLAVFLQMWSGFFWSGFNQSVQNFMLDAVTPPKRARCSAYLSLITNFGLLVGGVTGAIAIRFVPVEIGPLHLRYPFWTLLIASFVLRSGTVLFFLPRFREVRDVPQIGVVQMLYSTTRDYAGSAVNLMSGLVQRGGRES